MIDPRDMAHCRESIRTGSLSFHAASRLLPGAVRDPALALYAFCRMSDDAVDEGADKGAAVLALRDRLDLVYRGTPADAPADRAFAAVVEGFDMPRALPEALLEGFAWDAVGRRYDDLSGVMDYSARVAAAVGAMMCVLMRVRDPDALARACDLGLAMQLTNIARDVGEDARNGRVYLPSAWLKQAGTSSSELLGAPQATPAVKEVVGRLLQEADRLYKQAQSGIAELPADCRAAILAAGLIYAEIGHQLRRAGLDSVSRRTVVSTRRKLMLLVSAWTQAGWIYSDPAPQAPLDAIAFLTTPKIPHESERFQAASFPNRAVPQRIEWVLGLFERLENERRGKKPASHFP